MRLYEQTKFFSLRVINDLGEPSLLRERECPVLNTKDLCCSILDLHPLGGRNEQPWSHTGLASIYSFLDLKHEFRVLNVHGS